jgi:hypothetical protein
VRGFGRHNRSGRAYAVSSMTPIIKGHEAALQTYLNGLTTSPFARFSEVHFARWVLIDQWKTSWPGAPRRPLQLKSQYLCFGAAVTAPDDASAPLLPQSFLRRIPEVMPVEADEVWGHCVGYPGSAKVDEVAAYLERSLLDTVLFYVGYPDATVAQVRQAVARRDGFAQFARTHQHSDPAQLQQDYIREAATWQL